MRYDRSGDCYWEGHYRRGEWWFLVIASWGHGNGREKVCMSDYLYVHCEDYISELEMYRRMFGLNLWSWNTSWPRKCVQRLIWQWKSVWSFTFHWHKFKLPREVVVHPNNLGNFCGFQWAFDNQWWAIPHHWFTKPLKNGSLEGCGIYIRCRPRTWSLPRFWGGNR